MEAFVPEQLGGFLPVVDLVLDSLSSHLPVLCSDVFVFFCYVLERVVHIIYTFLKEYRANEYNRHSWPHQ